MKSSRCPAGRRDKFCGDTAIRQGGVHDLNLPRLEIDARIDPHVSQVGKKVHEKAEQREDIEIGEHDRIITIDDRFERKQTKPVERKDRFDEERTAEEGGDKGAGKTGDDDHHGVAKDMTIEHAALAQAFHPRRLHILLGDLVKERVLGQECRGREGAKRHRHHRQSDVPEIIGDLAGSRKLWPVLGGEAAKRKNLPERAAAKKYDEQNREEETWDRIAGDDGGRGPNIEARAVADRLPYP